MAVRRSTVTIKDVAYVWINHPVASRLSTINYAYGNPRLACILWTSRRGSLRDTDC